MIGSKKLSIDINHKLGQKILGTIKSKQRQDIININKLIGDHSIENAEKIIKKMSTHNTGWIRSPNGEWSCLSDESQYFTKDGYILAGCIWGDERIYMNSLASMGWPTLMDSLQIDKNNFEKYTFLAYTTIESVDSLKSIIDKINPDIRVMINVSILENNEHALINRGMTWINTILKAIQSNSTVIVWAPDNFYGKGLHNLVKKCPKGGVAAAPVIRVSQDNLYAFHEKLVQQDKINSLSNKQLANLAFCGEWHHPFQLLYTNNITSIYSSVRTKSSLKLYSWTDVICL